MDTWALNQCSAPDYEVATARFLVQEGYTPVIDTLSLVEVYNPGWQNATSSERGDRVASLLASLPFVIANPVEVARREFESYPEPLARLPVALHADRISAANRREALLGFLRAAPEFRAQGKDVREMARSYEGLKRSWTASTQDILEKAVAGDLLRRKGQGYEPASPASREEFLCSLDRRFLAWFTNEERAELGTKIVELVLGMTSRLRSVRLSSLLFYYSYVEVDSQNRLGTSGSDSGDYWHLLLAPYCAAATVDRTMKRLVERAREEAGVSFRAFDAQDLRTMLATHR